MEKNLISKEEKKVAITAIRLAAAAYKDECKGLNSFCNSLLASNIEGIKKTLQAHDLQDKKSIFTFLRDNTLYVDHDGNICKKVSNKDCKDLKQFVKVENYTINLLITAVVGHLTERQKKVVDCTLYYTAKGDIIADKNAKDMIQKAKVAQAAQAAQAAKIAELKEKVYNDYISSQSK